MSIRLAVVLSVVAASILVPDAAPGQSLGTFRWQQQPYCNVLVVHIVQNGAVYNVNGIDDQCGAGTAAAVVGMAFPNPNGSIGLGFTVVTTPGGTALHLDATVSLPTASGTWRDSTGASGAFVLTPGAPQPGSPRPVVRAAFPGGLSAGGTTITNVGAPAAGTDAANRNYVDGATANVRAAMIGEKVWTVRVTSSGFKQTTGPYTTSRTSTGRYLVRVNVTGLGIAAGPFPVAVTSSTGVTTGNAPIIVGTCGLGTVASGGFLTEIQAFGCTYDSTGAPMDAALSMLISMPDADAGSPVPPLDHGPDHADRTCTTEGDTTRCSWRP
jgi:hypothetical protein